MTLTTNHPKILDFYNNNPSFDFETINLTLIDWLNSLLQNSNNDSSNMNSLFTKMNTQELLIEKLASEIRSSNEISKLSKEKTDTDIQYIRDSLSRVSSDVINNVSSQLSELKTNHMQSMIQEVTDSLKNVDNNKPIIDLISETLNRQSDSLIDKTKVFFSEHIQTNVSSMIQNSHVPLLQSINASEQRLNESLVNIRDTSTHNKSVTDEIKQEVSEYFQSSKKNSSIKGKVSENRLYHVLSSLYPSAEIVNNTDTDKHSGDFYIKRKSKPVILIENKDYNTNVGPAEVEKFIRDITIQNVHGIFISQQTGITLKENYEIDIHKNNVLVYLHNVNYNSQLIKGAVEIIDSLECRLQEIESEGNTISNADLDEINNEFKKFMTAKQECTEYLNEFSKKMNSMINKINLSCLDKYLSTKYAYVKSSNFECIHCGLTWNSKRALSAHMKACKPKEICENVLTINT